ncbi:DUF6207 family protein [Streptomyces goshikiensis]|uniref:DUF6207 family protein n=1 Tax=Streptomyces goshikiensis TaxID=1942 RepID=UPI0036B73CA2
MKPIDERHIAEPGLVVLDITGGDEDTVQAVMAMLRLERGALSGHHFLCCPFIAGRGGVAAARTTPPCHCRAGSRPSDEPSGSRG